MDWLLALLGPIFASAHLPWDTASPTNACAQLLLHQHWTGVLGCGWGCTVSAEGVLFQRPEAVGLSLAEGSAWCACRKGWNSF